ncbi:MAG TPA: class I tRNA ligase family protein, partial [Tepidisphaeraceae bacterium]
CDTGPNFPKESLRKEKDIFDVWFESGSSWNGVLRAREPELTFPADMYLEGSDQHRGWFQLSMLPALASVGTVPFKSVLTHGFVVGPDGKKVSKSDKNYVTAVQEINKHGADVLRLFISSCDYEGDMSASPQMIKDFGDKYRKIRNTLRYLMSNLYDYDGSVTDVPAASLDGWVLSQLDELIIDVTKAYDTYAFHRVFRAIHDFCAVQISAVYGNAMKDRLYCDLPNSPLRRRSQQVMQTMLIALTKLMAPVLVFTADEAWEAIAHKDAAEANLASVHLATLPKPSGRIASDADKAAWARLFELREQALAQLDKLKKEQGVNKSVDTEAVYKLKPTTRTILEGFGVDLEDVVSAGSSSIVEGDDTVELVDRRNDYAACARSWKRRKDVGSDPEYPDLTLRDAAAVKAKR